MQLSRTFGKPGQAEPIKTPPNIQREAGEIFTRHGCEFRDEEEYLLVTFPEGTIKREIYPRPGVSLRYEICFPDGYTIEELYDRHRELSFLFYKPGRAI